jgi:hypothetical protein
VATIAMVLGGFAVAGSLNAGAATVSVPSITISPSIGLTNGQSVTITGTGFAPNEASLVAVECNETALAVGEAGCNVGAIDPITVSASGDFTSTFVVATGAIGTGSGAGSCGTTAADANCFISVGSTATGANVAGASINFSTGPGVAISPSTGLTNGASVTITGSGFADGDSVYAVECLETATSEAGCDTSTATPIAVSSTGTLPSTTFKVVAGTVGTGTCGTTATNYDGCIIEVANLADTDVGFATIDFSVPAVTTVPAPSATRVSGTAVIGKSVAAVVIGKNFTAVSRVTGGAGSTIAVTGVASTALHVKITESAHARAGSYTLVILFKDGKSARVKYTVR